MFSHNIIDLMYTCVWAAPSYTDVWITVLW